MFVCFFVIEAQENADEYSNEVEQLRGVVARNEEEKQRLEAELVQVKEMLQREVGRADAESRRSVIIINEYKQVNGCFNALLSNEENDFPFRSFARTL